MPKRVEKTKLKILTNMYLLEFSSVEIAKHLRVSKAWVDKWSSQLKLRETKKQYDRLREDNIFHAEVLINESLIKMKRGGISNRKRSVLNAAIADLKSYLKLHEKEVKEVPTSKVTVGKVSVRVEK